MKRVLFVTYDYPYPTNTGGKNRAFNMLKHSKGNFRKYLFSFIREDFRNEYVSHIAKIGVETIGLVSRRKLLDIKNLQGLLTGKSIFKSLYYSKEVEDKIIALIRKHDIEVVHFESFFTGFFISEKIRELEVSQIFGSENIESKLYRDIITTAPFFLRPLYKYQVEKIHEEEKTMFKKSDISLAVSEADCNEARKYNKCVIVRNGVDLDILKYIKPKRTASRLLFVGNFTYHPNIDAINYFYDEVFKKLDVSFTLNVIGKGVGRLAIAKDPRIKVTDFVPEISDAYKNADIIVAPVRLGGGTNFKILEAFAVGVPVVSLPHRLEGLKVTDRKNIMIAKDSNEFVRKIYELSADFSLRKRISQNARELVEKEYSWDVAGEHLSRVWDTI